jgi:hypothetical protein
MAEDPLRAGHPRQADGTTVAESCSSELAVPSNRVDPILARPPQNGEYSPGLNATVPMIEFLCPQEQASASSFPCRAARLPVPSYDAGLR